MMDIYVKMEMIAKYLHFIIGKWALNSPNRKLLNYGTEEYSSVGKMVIFKVFTRMSNKLGSQFWKSL